MAEIFVSYTSKDRDWAFWIGQELEKLGHVPRIDAWEISGGGNIMAWMQERLEKAGHALCVISEDYFKGPFASAEQQAALWAVQNGRKNFLLPVRITDCELPLFLAPLKHCDLFGADEDKARARLAELLSPVGRPSAPTRFPGFPGAAMPAAPGRPEGKFAFPGEANRPSTNVGRSRATVSNIPINVPRHFLGRDNDLAAIEEALNSGDGRAAITALHGLRGVGKTVLAAAYAEKHARNYRATWWIRAETEPTMRADLVGLGVRLSWLPADVQEEAGLKLVMDRLRQEGDAILLIYDNAVNAKAFEKCAPLGGTGHVIVTSNAPDWRGFATPVEIEVWPPQIGANFLIERTGRAEERSAALALSDALGGLPLAHEQAAAYCERLGVSLATYASRFDAAPGKFLDDERGATKQYYNGLTVSKTFLLAIDAAASQHPAAEQLIVYVALLAPEPIPLDLFLEGHAEFSEPFASSIQHEELDEALGALRAFALIDREAIRDERDPSIVIECVRLHRLTRQIAASRRTEVALEENRRELIYALSVVYPANVFNDPKTWPLARRLDVLARGLAGDPAKLPKVIDRRIATLLDKLGGFQRRVVADFERALAFHRAALQIRREVFGPGHPNIAASLNNLGSVLKDQGDLDGAEEMFRQALAMDERTYGLDDPEVAADLNNLAVLLTNQGQFDDARAMHERALTIIQKEEGPDSPNVARVLNNLGTVSLHQYDFSGARDYFERALAISQRQFGSEHLYTGTIISNLAVSLQFQGKQDQALKYFELGLSIHEKNLGLSHPTTKIVATNFVSLLGQLKLSSKATVLRQKFGLAEGD